MSCSSLLKMNVIRIFSFVLVLAMCASILYDKYLLPMQIDAIKYAALMLMFFAFLITFYKGRVVLPTAVIFLFILAIFPIFIHGYLNIGLLFHALILTAIMSIGADEKVVLKSSAIYVFILLLLVIIGLFVTGDFVFLRESVYPAYFYAYTPLSNPNVFSRYMVIMLPLLILCRESGYVSLRTFWPLLFGIVLSVMVVSSSRANAVALIFMGIYWIACNKKISLPQFVFVSLILCALLAWVYSSPVMQHKLRDLSRIIEQTHELIVDAKSDRLIYERAPSRAKTWAASYVVIKQNIFFGVGMKAGDDVAEAGARKMNRETGVLGKKIAVHGGWLNIATSTGMIGLVIFLAALSMLYIRMDSIGRMFLVGTAVSQIGANVYSYTLFWIVLGFLLFRASTAGSNVGSGFANSSSLHAKHV